MAYAGSEGSEANEGFQDSKVHEPACETGPILDSIPLPSPLSPGTPSEVQEANQTPAPTAIVQETASGEVIDDVERDVKESQAESGIDQTLMVSLDP